MPHAKQLAFPNYFVDEDSNPIAHDGMDLRTYIATKALAGVLASYAGSDINLPGDEVAARMAVDYADALINELNK